MKGIGSLLISLILVASAALLQGTLPLGACLFLIFLGALSYLNGYIKYNSLNRSANSDHNYS
jgi:hypothetical protein